MADERSSKQTTTEKISELHKHWDRIRSTRESDFEAAQKAIKTDINNKIAENLNRIVEVP